MDQNDSITRHSLILLRRREDIQRRILGTDSDGPLGEFEAFLTAQCYSVSLDAARGIEFTAVVHDGKVNFLRRVLDVEPVDEDTWPGGVHFATLAAPAYLRAIEGRPYPRNLRATKYRGVSLCHDTATGDVWIEDEGGRVC